MFAEGRGCELLRCGSVHARLESVQVVCASGHLRQREDVERIDGGGAAGRQIAQLEDEEGCLRQGGAGWGQRAE